jgi:hypothetical protein
MFTATPKSNKGMVRGPKWMRAEFERLRREQVLNAPLNSPDIIKHHTPAGVSLRIHNPPGGIVSSNFIANATGSSSITIGAGTYNGAPPTVNGLLLSEPRTMNLGGGDQYLYLRVTYLLSATASGYVYAAELLSAVMVLLSALISNPLASQDAEFNILMAAFTNRAKTGQFYRTSLIGGVRDDGLSHSKGNLEITPI